MTKYERLPDFLSGVIVGAVVMTFCVILYGLFVYSPAPEIVEKPVPVSVPHVIEMPTQVIVEIDAPAPEYETFEVTAYTAGPESTGKTEDSPLYGVTASGKYVKENHTLACPRSLPFGTRIEIPYFSNVFTCEDRGGAITEGKLDVYMPDLDDALEFGRRKLDVRILSKPESEGIVNE